MKTLDEVEPRIPISELPYTIEESGSYYLTDDLTGVDGDVGISIEASHVTLDLMGYSIRGVPGSRTGIWARSENITIRNGSVTGFDVNGIDLGLVPLLAGVPMETSPPSRGGLIEGVHASGNGSRGIVAGEGMFVRHCTATGNGRAGIFVHAGSVVEGSVATGNEGAGITSIDSDVRVRDCVASGNHGGGILLAVGGSVTGSTASDNGDVGISGDRGSSISHSVARGNVEDGIRVTSGCRVVDSQVAYNGGDGVRVTLPPAFGNAVVDGVVIRDTTVYGNEGAGLFLPANSGDGFGDEPVSPSNRVEGNHLTGNARGLVVLSSGNVIVRNSARGNSEGNFEIADGNEVGPIGTMAEVGEHPWANFSIDEIEGEDEE